MTDVVHSLSEMFASWQQTFSDSKPIATAVIATHVLALLFGGGLAVSADRGVLKRSFADAESRFRLLSDMRTMHTTVIVSIGVLFVTGLALAAADVDTYLVSPIFWCKARRGRTKEVSSVRCSCFMPMTTSLPLWMCRSSRIV